MNLTLTHSNRFGGVVLWIAQCSPVHDVGPLFLAIPYVSVPLLFHSVHLPQDEDHRTGQVPGHYEQGETLRWTRHLPRKFQQADSGNCRVQRVGISIRLILM